MHDGPESVTLLIDGIPRKREWHVVVAGVRRRVSHRHFELLLELIVALRERSHHTLYASQSLSLAYHSQPRTPFLRLAKSLGEELDIVSWGDRWCRLKVDPENIVLGPGVFELPPEMIHPKIIEKLRRYYPPSSDVATLSHS